MRKIILAACFLITLFFCLPSVNYADPGCDKAAAKKVMLLMKEMIQKTETDAGWTIITFGNDYFSWTDRQCEGMVTTYANADACLTGKARNLEFRSPSGKLIARADSLRGIQMK